MFIVPLNAFLKLSSFLILMMKMIKSHSQIKKTSKLWDKPQIKLSKSSSRKLSLNSLTKLLKSTLTIKSQNLLNKSAPINLRKRKNSSILPMNQKFLNKNKKKVLRKNNQMKLKMLRLKFRVNWNSSCLSWLKRLKNKLSRNLLLEVQSKVRLRVKF